MSAAENQEILGHFTDQGSPDYLLATPVPTSFTASLTL
jgi:hypothetical protein